MNAPLPNDPHSNFRRIVKACDKRDDDLKSPNSAMIAWIVAVVVTVGVVFFLVHHGI